MDKKKRKNYNPIFNKQGKANYYLGPEMKTAYNWEGDPLAIVEKGAVMTFKGKHLGWFEDGWLRDMKGNCVGFCEPTGKGGPNPPKAKYGDPPADKKEAPDRPEVGELPKRPPRRAIWSDITDKSFFKG